MRRGAGGEAGGRAGKGSGLPAAAGGAVSGCWREILGEE